jgi:uncharacterized membrane protein
MFCCIHWYQSIWFLLVPDPCWVTASNGNNIQHRGHHHKRYQRLLFPLFEDNMVVVLRIFDIAYWNVFPGAPAYGVHISQLLRYWTACGCYHDLLDIRLLLTMMLPNQGLQVVKLKLSLWQIYDNIQHRGHHHKRYQRLLFLLFEDNMVVVLRIFDIAYWMKYCEK